MKVIRLITIGLIFFTCIQNSFAKFDKDKFKQESKAKFALLNTINLEDYRP